MDNQTEGEKSSPQDQDLGLGPRVGLALSVDEATILLKRHKLGELCSSLAWIDRGYNNRSYLATSEAGREFVIRLGGRFWTRMKTENEVATITYLSRTINPLKLKLPRILGFCSSREKSPVGHEYILMEKLPGVPLDDVFPQLSFDEKTRIVDQVVDILCQLKSLSFEEIGSFRFSPSVGDTFGVDLIPGSIDLSDIYIGPGLEAKGGPFSTYLEYLRVTMTTQLESLKVCRFVLEVMGNLVPRLEKFIKTMTDAEITPLSEEVTNVPFKFTHGDFEPRNLLVDKDTLEITGILDFEFAGSFPEDEEWFAGFVDFGGANSSEELAFGAPRGKGKEDATSGGGVGSEGPSQDKREPLKDYFLQMCENKGVKTPAGVRGHETRALLYYFKENICPWWLKEEVDNIPSKWHEDRLQAKMKVEKVLEMFGF